MYNFRFFKKTISTIIFLSIMVLFFGSIVFAQWDIYPLYPNVWPQSLWFIYPPYPYYTMPLYFNSIDYYLLGHTPFTPFLTNNAATSYALAGIPAYPYLNSPYQTTFPYTTLPNTSIPYSRFSYPAYAYGTSDFYLNWVLLQ